MPDDSDFRTSPDWWRLWESEIDEKHKRGLWKDRWRAELRWKATDLASLCCGWAPDSDAFPPRQPFVDAMERIIRAVEVGELAPLGPIEGTPSREQFYHLHPFIGPTMDDAVFNPGSAPVVFEALAAARWAVNRFQAFPFQLSELIAPDVGAVKEGDGGPAQVVVVIPKREPFDPKVLGANLRQLAKAAGLTHEELGKRIGVEVTTIKRNFSGRQQPQPANLKAYLALFRDILNFDQDLTTDMLMSSTFEIRARSDSAPKTE